MTINKSMMTWTKINKDHSNLPAACTSVIVTMADKSTNYRWTIAAYFDGDRLFYDLSDNLIHSKVIAWMDMPGPCME